MRHYLTILLVVICAIAQAQNEKPKLLQYETNEYAINFPTNWKLDKSGKLGSAFIVFSPRESESDNFLENVNLFVQDLTQQQATLAEFVASSENQIKTLITNGKILSSQVEKRGDTEFHQLVYSGTQGKLNLVYVQYIWLIDFKAYVLTFTVEQQKFKGYKPAGELVLNSFRFK